jgi:hypothetical protein
VNCHSEARSWPKNLYFTSSLRNWDLSPVCKVFSCLLILKIQFPKQNFLVYFPPVDPIRECLPVRIALGFKLPSTRMERITTGFGS